MSGVKHPIYQSVLRKQSFLGCDRELCMLLVFITIVGSIFSFSLVATVVLLLVFIMLYLCLLKMAKDDLYLRKVYLKNIRYKPYYLAQKTYYSRQSVRKNK